MKAMIGRPFRQGLPLSLIHIYIAHQYVVITMNAARLTDTHYAYTEANQVRRVEKRTTALGAEGEQLEVTETWLPAAHNEYALSLIHI